MKKLLTLILVCLLIALPLLGLIGCDSTPDEPDTPDDPITPDEPTDPNTPVDPTDTPTDGIVLVADGVAQYRIVRSDFAKEDVKNLSAAFRRAIETVTGVKPALVTDYEDENDNADIKEILIGKTNRPESAQLSGKLGGAEYGYEVIGNKIVIAGASNALLEIAALSFLKTYVGYTSEEDYTMNTTLTIPKDLSVIKSNDHSRDVALYTVKGNVSYLDALQKSLKSVTSSVTLMTQNDDPSAVFDLQKYGLVIVAGADTMLASAKPAMEGYLNAGGRVLLLGGPTFDKEITFFDWEGEQLSLSEYSDVIYDEIDKDDAVLMLDTSNASILSSLVRTTNDSSSPNKVTISDYGLKGSSAQLYHEVPTITNWDMLAYNIPTAGKGNNVIALKAKPGNANTEHFTLEIWEKDGTRWYANAVFESDAWKSYIFTEETFSYFQGPGSGREKPEFDNITKIQIGYATSFYGIGDGNLAYYLSEPMLCKVDGVVIPREKSYTLELDTISPLYEQYPITNAANIVVEEEQAFITERNYVVPKELFSCHPGRQGNGFNKGSDARFVPLLRVTDEKGLHSGYAAWMQIFSSKNNTNGALEGAIVGCFSAASDDFYNADGIAAVTEAVVAMTRNAFIVDGGATEYLYVEEETNKVNYGISYVMMNGADTTGMTLNVALYKGDTVLAEITTSLTGAAASTSGVRIAQAVYDLSDGKPDRAEATIRQDDKVIDRVAHSIRFWSPKPASELSFVYVEDGYFKKDGEIINFFGVNYLPSYNVANYPEENISGAYYNLYCADPAYDPEVIAYDLARIKDLGMNAISFSCNGVSNNLLDLILQCEDLGLYVDLSISGRGAYPLYNFGAESATKLIESLYLNQIDTIIAYDIAWEPRIGSYDNSSSNRTGRKQWDDDFTAWVKVQYGSIEAA